MHHRKTTMLKPVQCLFVLTLAAAAWVCLSPSTAHTQTADAGPQADTLASLVPADAVFYVERAGHTAVRDAFLASNLGVVSVAIRPSSSPIRLRLCESSTLAGSLSLPPAQRSLPIYIIPPRNVPVVTTTVSVLYTEPLLQVTARTLSFSVIISVAIASTMVKLAVSSSFCRIKSAYFCLSAWARGDCTAGPFERFSSRN